MSVAKVSDIVSELTKTATAAVNDTIAKQVNGGNQTLRNLRVWWVKEERVTKGAISEYQVNMVIGFVIDD